MSRYVNLCLLCALTISCASAPAPRPGDERSGSGAAAALEEYAGLIRAMHPAPWRFIKPADFDALVAAEASRLRARRDLGALEVAASFQRVASSLRDAHMAVTLEAFQPGVALGPVFLPLAIKRVEGAWVVDAAPEPSLVGARLVAVGGEPLEGVLRDLWPLVVSDGVGEGPRERRMERDFGRLYHLARGLRATYVLTVEDAAGRREVELAGMEREAVAALWAQRKSWPVWGLPARESGQLPFVVPAGQGVLWVRMSSFGSPDIAGYEARVDALMRELGAARILVIDLRGNEGGLRTHGVALLNHVLGAPYAQWTRFGVRARSVPAVYRDRVSAAFGTSLEALRGFPAPDEAGRSWVMGDPLEGRMRPRGVGFGGQVVVLADGLTGSAANELIVALKHARPEVVLVGEEVGGGCAGHVGELPVVWRSPGYGVMTLMSLIEIEHVAVDGCQPGRGLTPDVAVVYSRQDFDDGVDPYEGVVRGVLCGPQGCGER